MSTSPHFPATRSAALERLEEFIPAAGRYASRRNHVLIGHDNVSRLSAAVRHRLVTEQEVAAAPLEQFAPSTIQKFTQEIYWRTYWKSWLSLRPDVWTSYTRELTDLKNTPAYDRSEAMLNGGCDLPLMQHFIDELKNTGYLHNHARMWFAAWWVHTAELPWQLGADFFFRHLNDGDPASNTLSWRWVAGLQTPGKTYLARKSNIEKYLDPELYDQLEAGLDVLVSPEAIDLPDNIKRPDITQKSLPEFSFDESLKTGIWLHEEDLLPEKSPIAELTTQHILVTPDTLSWDEIGMSGQVKGWKTQATHDAAKRSRAHFSNTQLSYDEDAEALAKKITRWAVENDLQQVAALRPDVGIIGNQVKAITQALDEQGITLALFDRPLDLDLRPFATAGFFGFWKKIEKRLKAKSSN